MRNLLPVLLLCGASLALPALGQTTVVVTPTGLGIGTSSPTVDLHIQHDAASLNGASLELRNDAIYTDATNDAAHLRLTTSLSTVDDTVSVFRLTKYYTPSVYSTALTTNAPGGLVFSADNSTAQMVLAPSGKLGLGVPAPAYPLDFSTGSFYAVHFRGTYPEGTALLLESADSGAIYQIQAMGTSLPARAGRYEIQNYNTGRVSFSITNSAGDVYLAQDGGNVGVGTTSPGYKLEVAGPVKATEFISNTATYADFVFEPGYRLPPLAEVEREITRTHHLPGIPAAAEVAKGGLDLGAMDVALLQKVEELTLHLIELEKENRSLRTRVDALETETHPR